MNEQTIFIAALERGLAERNSFLEEACSSDSDLRRRVEKLLAVHEQAAHFMDQPAGQFAATIGQTPAMEQPGLMIGGRYKLLEQIGEGGMGTVWVAEQIEPVRRRVALKLVKPGMDTRQVIARFEAERQALALMDHPNIARVLDAGATELGRPFFVMEYVKGFPITKYCDDVRLTVRERLQLFAQVCQAVQHAHQKGIIHRDLKPSNILVCLYDGQPVPKVIDFGLAKAMHQPLTDHTLYTAHGLMVGTPLYMSPEQAESNNLDVDTRTDIYSLGVILYELLTGSTPLEKQQFKNAAFQEILRLIKEVEPPKPSTKISGSAALPSVAAQRRLNPAQLNQMVQGDLDWIVMKSLEKDRSNRYETANGLARDIQRFLSDQPVEACPPSPAYRFRKFARRNRVAITTAVIVIATLFLGTVVSTWQAIRATQAEHAAETQRAQAEANFQKARIAVDEYFTLVSESKLLDVPGLQPLRKDLLEAALRFYQGFAVDRTDDPDVLVDVAVTYLRVAEIYHTINRNDDAVAAVSQALEIIDRLRREHPDARAEHCKLAGFWRGWRRTQPFTALPRDPKAAFQTIQRLVETWKKLSDENPSVIAFQSDLAAINSHLGDLLTSLRQHAQGVSFLLQARSILNKLSRDDPAVPQYRADLAQACYGLALNLPIVGRSQEAEAACRESVSLREQLVAEFPANALYRDDLAFSLDLLGRLDNIDPGAAEEASRRCLALREQLVAEFPGVPQRRHDLIRSFMQLGKLLARNNPLEAEQACRHAVELAQAFVQDSPGIESRETLSHALVRFAGLLGTLGKHREADAIRRQVIEMNEKWVAEYPEIPNYRERLGHDCRIIAGQQSDRAQWPDVEQNLRKAIEAFTRLASDDPGSGSHRNFLTDTLNQLGDHFVFLRRTGEAELCYRQAIANDPKRAWPRYNLARLLTRQDKIEEAVTEAHQAVRLAPNEFVVHTGLLDILTGIGDNERTLRIVRENAAAFPNSAAARFHLGRALERQGGDDEAVLEWRKTITLDPEGERPHLAIADLLVRKNRLDEALAETREAVRLRPAMGLPRCKLGEVLARDGQRNEAVGSYLKAIELEPQNGDFFEQLRNLISDRAGLADQAALIHMADLALAGGPRDADWCAIRGRWREATAGMFQRIESRPEDHFPWFQTASLFARSGDDEGFRRHCREMLARFGDTQDPNIAERVAKACLILPGTADELTLPRQLADRAVTLAPRHRDIAFFELAQALAQYRTGQFASAREWLDKCLAREHGTARYGAAMAQLLQAMVYARLGDEDEGRRLFVKASKYCDRLPQIANGQLLYTFDWHDGLAVEILREEAEELFEQPDPAREPAAAEAIK